jgi:outer membrane protein TolC
MLTGNFQATREATQSDSLLPLAERQRSDYKTAVDGVRSAQAQLQLAGTNSNASVNSNFSYGLRNGYIPNLDVLRGNYATGISVEVPLFDGDKTGNMEEESRANLLAAQQQQRDIENQIQADIEQSLADMTASRQKLTISSLSVEQAGAAAEMARVKYDSGVITNLDLLDAGTALEEAKLNRLRAEFGLIISQYELMKAVGEKIW